MRFKSAIGTREMIRAVSKKREKDKNCFRHRRAKFDQFTGALISIIRISVARQSVFFSLFSRHARRTDIVHTVSPDEALGSAAATRMRETLRVQDERTLVAVVISVSETAPGVATHGPRRRSDTRSLAVVFPQVSFPRSSVHDF